MIFRNYKPSPRLTCAAAGRDVCAHHSVEQSAMQNIPHLVIASFLICFLCLSYGEEKSPSIRQDPKILGREAMEKLPELAVDMNAAGGVTIDGEEFTLAQLTVIVKQLLQHEPNLVLRIRGTRDQILHSRPVVRAAASGGLDRFLFNGADDRKDKDSGRKEPIKTSILTPAAPPYPAVMTATISTPCFTLATGQAKDYSTFYKKL